MSPGQTLFAIFAVMAFAPCWGSEPSRSCAQPTYPTLGLGSGMPADTCGDRAGHEGTVVLHLCISARGKVTEALIEESSGFECLDRRALDWAKATRWKPGSLCGIAQPMCYSQPYRFKFQD